MWFLLSLPKITHVNLWHLGQLWRSEHLVSFRNVNRSVHTALVFMGKYVKYAVLLQCVKQLIVQAACCGHSGMYTVQVVEINVTGMRPLPRIFSTPYGDRWHVLDRPRILSAALHSPFGTGEFQALRTVCVFTLSKSFDLLLLCWFIYGTTLTFIAYLQA